MVFPTPAILIIFYATHTTLATLQCPDTTGASIAPCVCVSQTETLTCSGSLIDQAKIDDVIGQLRTANGLTAPDDQLLLRKLELTNTAVNGKLNLVGLQYTTTTELILDKNANLTGFNTTAVVSGSIQAAIISVKNCPQLEDAGALELLSRIDKNVLTILYMENNLLTLDTLMGSANDVYPEVCILNLAHNRIHTIQPNKFNNFPKLTNLDLSNNRISELKPNALSINQPGSILLDQPLVVNLSSNGLTDAKIGDLNGLRRPTSIDLTNNNFVYLTLEKFGGFLFSNFDNKVTLEGNSIVCTSYWMQWMRDSRDILENRVSGMDCLNDPGQTVFDTDLLHSQSSGGQPAVTFQRFWFVVTTVGVMTGHFLVGNLILIS